MVSGGPRAAVFIFWALLWGAAAALNAQAGETANTPSTTVQGINRPMRSKNSSIPHSSFHISQSPLPTLHHYPLLTQEALDQPLTRRYIQQYSSPSGIKWLNSIIGNGSIYFPYIREEIENRSMPPELLFLPFIESGYIGTAQSKSGAVGIWQFMMNSIGTSIKVNDMIDERRDFQKSTIAALRKLEENYRALGNWPMALAAYNAGLGAASRAVQRTKTSDYWVLCAKNEFKTETVHYVPKLLAVAYILTQPRYFGVDYWPEAVEWTAIKPSRQASIDIIALETGADRSVLRRLNHELLLGITPPDKNYELKVPLSHADSIVALLESSNSRLIHFYSYRIQYGDTLSALSRHYGVSLNVIEQYNPGILNRLLKIGETVIIPSFANTPVAPPPIAPQIPPPGPGNIAFNGAHVVAQGDTLWSIANRYGVDPQALASANNMAMNQILSIGKVLKVPIIE